MDLASDIGASLSGARRAQRMRQRELAERLGTTQQQIARWESTGYRTASLERVVASAAALGVALTCSSGAITTPLAAGTAAPYRAGFAPARDLAEVIVRLRANADELRDRFGVRRLGVYGSFVTGTQRADSDVDLLAELERVTFDAELGAAARLQEILGRRVDLALPKELRPSLRERVLGEVLYVLDA